MDSIPEEIRKRYEELAAPTLAAPRMALMAGYVQHGQTTTLEHVAAVAYLSLAGNMMGVMEEDMTMTQSKKEGYVTTNS